MNFTGTDLSFYEEDNNFRNQSRIIWDSPLRVNTNYILDHIYLGLYSDRKDNEKEKS